MLCLQHNINYATLLKEEAKNKKKRGGEYVIKKNTHRI